MDNKRTKINFYCSIISPVNYNEEGDYYSFADKMGEHARPKEVEWIYGGGMHDFALKPNVLLPEDGVDISMFTEKDLLSPLVDQVKTKYKIVVIQECTTIHPFVPSLTKLVEDKFDYIFTCDSELLARGPKYVHTAPLGASTAFKYNEQKIYKKTKLASILASKKGHPSLHAEGIHGGLVGGNPVRGHKLRHTVVDFVKRMDYDVDVWGRAYRPFDRHVEALKDYYFNISIINAKEMNYFGDHPMSCFRTGTVPIFWGCPNIGDFFNEKGVLSFDTGQELKEILDNISPQLYYEMLEHVEDNFNRVQKYNCIDDCVFETIKETLKL
jgi:hypothetical protein